MTAKQQIRQQRIRAKQLEVSARAGMPRCNPWQYSQVKESYPSDLSHIDYRDPKRFLYTRLHEAVVGQNVTRVKELLELGANPWLKDRMGCSPLDLALNYWPLPEIAHLLQQQMDTILRQCKRYERDGQTAWTALS